jgi:hypothetical protein
LQALSESESAREFKPLPNMSRESPSQRQNAEKRMNRIERNSPEHRVVANKDVILEYLALACAVAALLIIGFWWKG